MDFGATGTMKVRKRLHAYQAPGSQYSGIKYVWTALTRSPVHKALLCCILFVRHLPSLMPLLMARRGSNLHRLVKARPEIMRAAQAVRGCELGRPDPHSSDRRSLQNRGRNRQRSRFSTRHPY